MGHHVQALIGSKASLDSVQQRFGGSRVVGLNQSLCLLPLTEQFYDALPSVPDTFAWAGEFRFVFLDSKVVSLIKEASKDQTMAYVETEYFGGDGGQGAIVARGGEIIFGPADGDGSINAAFRLLGVTKDGAHDEFEAVGFGRFRSNEDWIEQPRYG